MRLISHKLDWIDCMYNLRSSTFLTSIQSKGFPVHPRPRIQIFDLRREPGLQALPGCGDLWGPDQPGGMLYDFCTTGDPWKWPWATGPRLSSIASGPEGMCSFESFECHAQVRNDKNHVLYPTWGYQVESDSWKFLLANLNEVSEYLLVHGCWLRQLR